MNRQGLLCNLHCATTVVLREQLNFKSAVIRSNRSCLLGRRFFSSPVNSTSLSHVLVMLSKKGSTYIFCRNKRVQQAQRFSSKLKLLIYKKISINFYCHGYILSKFTLRTMVVWVNGNYGVIS